MPAERSPVARETKREILDLAESLLQERGFNGFSYQHIAERLGVKNAAIHYHFRAKGDLGVAVIERYRRRFGRWAERVDREESEPWRKLEAFFDIYVSYLLKDGRICPMGSLQADFKSIPEEMRQATSDLVTDMQGWLARTLADGRERGAFRFAGRPEDQAVVVSATLQGGLQIARACGPERFHAALEQLKLQMS
jgi:TetR/AcrR family transcriptional regulator, transcriptional repressor for nem operon